MMYDVNIADTALNDIKAAVSYMTDDLKSKSAAYRFLDTAEKELSSLSDLPERNSLVKDSFLASNGIRMQMINKYLAFYVIREETKSVTVLRVLHSRRDWISVLKDNINYSDNLQGK